MPDNTFHDGALADMAVAALARSEKEARTLLSRRSASSARICLSSRPRSTGISTIPRRSSSPPNPFRPKDAPEYAVLPGGELRNYDGVPAGHLPDDLARQLKHGYYAAISYMDAQVGRVLDELDRLGLRDNHDRRSLGRPRLETRRARRLVQAQQCRERHPRTAASSPCRA